MGRWMMAAGLAALMASPVAAGPAGDITRDALYAGALASGLSQLEPLAAADDPEAWFGIGALRLAQGFETLAQSLYRHGFSVPSTGSAFTQGIEVPLPANPDPEPLDYAGVRAMLEAFVAAFDGARDAFVVAGASGDYVVAINPLLIRMDADGDGTVGPEEGPGGLVALWSGTPVEQAIAAGEGGFSHIGFDRADAYWLAGYTQALASTADLLLAHDFSSFVDVVFHRLFPRAGFPLQDYALGGALMLDPETDTAIADLVAAIHTLSWPVVEPARLAGVRGRMKAVLGFSRQNWEAILAETDDDHELVPSPRQTSMIPDFPVDEQHVAAWLATLDQAERVIDGELLVPHWRFRQGVDLRAYFETATRTDLVLLITGVDAIPFLREGDVVSPEDFRQMQEAFGNDWLGYVFWFN